MIKQEKFRLIQIQSRHKIVNIEVQLRKDEMIDIKIQFRINEIIDNDFEKRKIDVFQKFKRKQTFS